MKRTLLILHVFFSASLQAQAPAAVPLSKEPHHRLVLENEYVRVFRVSVPAHAATLLHQHDVPYLYISLGPADVINAIQGRPEARIVMADGQVGYSLGHFAHIARTDAGSTFDNVTIELLKPQGEPHNLCERVAPGDSGTCLRENRANYYASSPLLETDEIRVFSVELQPKADFQEIPENAKLLIAPDKRALSVQLPGSHDVVVLSGGAIHWIPPGAAQIFHNTSDHPIRFLILSFKKQ